MLFYVFNKAKITKITGLCLGLVLLVGFIPTAQALPLPLSYFTPQQFSTFAGAPSTSKGSGGAVAGIIFTTSYERSTIRGTIKNPVIQDLIPGSLQASPDTAFPTAKVPGLVWGSSSDATVGSGTVTFTFDKPLNPSCHIFVDDVDLNLQLAFRFFDENNVQLDPTPYLVNDISTVTTGMPALSRANQALTFKGDGSAHSDLTQEIIPNVNTIRKIEAKFDKISNTKTGSIGVYFSCSIPHIRKAFNPATINQGEVSKLEFEIDVFGNPLFEAHFIDHLPTGLMVADPSNTSTDCGGGSSVTTPGTDRDAIIFHNLTLAYGNTVGTDGKCKVSVDVTNRPSQSNLDCSSSPAAFTNIDSNLATNNTLNTDGLHACLVVNLAYDFGDAPDSYSTILASSGARHTIAGPYLGAVPPDAEPDGQPNAAADGDDTNPSGGPDDEDGVTFKSFADGTSATFQIDAHVTGVNPTGKNAMLCGYLDGAGDGLVDGAFSRDIVYNNFVGTAHGAEAGPGNEEVCIVVYYSPLAPANEITVIPNTATPGFHGASAKCLVPQTNGNFSCTFTFNPDFTAPVTTYARFRITTDPKFFSLTSPSPTGSAIDGEVEGFRLLVDPTAVTIGEVELQAVSAADFIAGLGIGFGDTTTLLALLTAWDPEAAAELADAGAKEILVALKQYLDPDADGQVAVLRWDTLEERGTIGFYVERQVGEGDWARINNDMLPGLITAPMGAEYQLADPGARAGTVYNYRLIEQEARGSTRTYGPYTVDMP